MVCTSLQFLNKDSVSICPQQREALLHILSGCDMFINLPTGFGKSLIFELAPLGFDSPERNNPRKFEGANRIASSFADEII